MMQPAPNVLAVLLFIGLCCGCQPDTTSSQRIPPQPEAATITEYLGRWLVINYWAEWCAPCREEIPELNRLASHDPARIAVVGINYDGLVEAELSKVETTMAIAFPTLTADPSATLGYQRPNALPTTIIVNPKGQVASELQGPQTFAQLLALIDQHVNSAETTTH